MKRKKTPKIHSNAKLRIEVWRILNVSLEFDKITQVPPESTTYEKQNYILYSSHWILPD